MNSIDRIPPETVDRLTQSIFKKIPELNENWEAVYLSKSHIKQLSDEEFVVLWALPNIVIRVAKSAADYIQERKDLLGLAPGRDSSIRQEEKQSPRKIRNDDEERFDRGQDTWGKLTGG